MIIKLALQSHIKQQMVTSFLNESLEVHWSTTHVDVVVDVAVVVVVVVVDTVVVFMYYFDRFFPEQQKCIENQEQDWLFVIISIHLERKMLHQEFEE